MSNKPHIHTEIDRVDTPLAWVFIVHGLADHSGRYEHVAQYLNAHNYGAFRFDLRGFGKSRGLPCYISSFSDYVDDFFTAYGKFRSVSGGVPKFIIAHSMGALITAHAHIREPLDVDGVIFSGGLFEVNPGLSPLLQKLSSVISVILPKLKATKLDASLLSRDPEVVERTKVDPLHYTDGIRARTGAEVIKATKAIQSKLGFIEFPSLILHGGSDQITRPRASEVLHDAIAANDKSLKIYPGAYHELMMDLNKEEVLDDIDQWIRSKLA